MREIKFRAWDKERKQFWNLDGTDTLDIFDDDAFVMMQFTGLKDKNGKNIYDGDIVQKKNFDCIFRVVWIKQSTGFFIDCGKQRMPLSKLCEPLIEIIGNIYETPDLLPKEERTTKQKEQ